MERLGVDLRRCVRCAACSSLAPQVFQVTAKGTRVVRQPEASERAACRAAALICPTQAIAGAA